MQLKLAHHILEGDLVYEDGSFLAHRCVSSLFVIIFDHKNLRIMWRGSDGGASASDDVFIPSDHDSLTVLNAIRDASSELYGGSRCADKRKRASDPCIEDDGLCKCFRTSFININHAYTALMLYAHRRRMGGASFKLKTVVLAGDLGGRGINFKPHGFGHDPTRGTWIVQPHQGYLTDMFFMFDAVKNRQITTHGEYVLQAIGRLCTLTSDAELAKMDATLGTPPRLWTSISCYNIISTFAQGIQQWVAVMRDKLAGESIKDALVRNITSDPQHFARLYMIYALPTTDPRWARKELWVRQSRMMKADQAVGLHVRAARQIPQTPASWEIQHDPEADKQRQEECAVAGAEEMHAARERGEIVDDDGSDGAQQSRKSQRLERLSLPVGCTKVAKADVTLDHSVEGHLIYFKWNDGEYHQGEIAAYLTEHPLYNFDVQWADGRHGHKLSLEDYKHGRTARPGSWILLRKADADPDYD